MYNSLPPEGTLDPQQPWYNGRISSSSPQWDRMKAKLTGGTDASGTSYYSMVNISADEADEIIANMKKDPRGFPQMNMGDQKALYHYQNWIVSEYLGSQPKGEKLIDDKNVGKAPEGENVVYKKTDKNDVDNIVEKQEERLEEALTETSDNIMSAIDAIIEEDARKFEEFKKKQELEVKGKFQYDKPIGPEAMQGPKEPPKQTYSPEKDEDWESETNDQLGTKLDDLLEQVRKDPLPQPSKTKRRKTRGKKRFDRKVLSSDTMGLGKQLSEIKINVVDTRQILFNLYKLEKERFEFKKKIDKKLTNRSIAKKREEEIEKTKPNAGDSNTSIIKSEEENSGLGGLLGFLLGPFKKAGIAGLTAALTGLALPVILDAVEAFMTRPLKGERNQWYDPLGIIPDPVGDEEDDPLQKFGEYLAPSAENSAEPSVRDGSRTPEGEAKGFADFWADVLRTDPNKSNEPSVRSGDRTPQTGFDYVPSMDDDGKQYGDVSVNNDGDSLSLTVPVQRAYDGGRFAGGVKKPLKPIKKVPNVPTEVKKLTKPLSSAVTLPQKAATLGVLNLANNLVQPFATLMPKEGNDKISKIFKDLLDQSGLGDVKMPTPKANLFEKITNFINHVAESLFKINLGGGGGGNNTPSPPPSDGGGDQYYGPAFGPQGDRESPTITETPTQTPTQTSSAADGSVNKVIIGAGHAPTVENAARGIELGSDGRSVVGTADDGSSGRNTPGTATGVKEWQATKHVVDTLKVLVEERGLGDKIGFQDIYSWDTLSSVPRSVESTPGQQYVDLHFDARGYGKTGVLPSANESATDRSLMAEFGRYSSSFKPSSKGVTKGGGTLLELAAIDDPSIRGLLEEVKKGEQGPASIEMAEKILRGILPSIGSAPKKTKTKMSGLAPTKQDMDWYNNIMNPETKPANPANPKPEPPGRQPKPDFLQFAPAFMQQPRQEQIPSKFRIPNANIPQGFRPPQQPGT